MLSLLLLSAAAAQIKPARPMPPFDWIGSMEYPKEALRIGERGTVALRVTVSPTGDVVRCESQEKTPLNKAACKHMMSGRKFLSAMDADGKPAYGIFKWRGRFAIQGTTNPPRIMPGIDMALTLNAIPQGAPDPSYVIILYTMSAEGKVNACVPQSTVKAQSQDILAFLGKIACDEMGKSPPPVVRDEKGRAVSSVHSAEIKFGTIAAMSAAH